MVKELQRVSQFTLLFPAASSWEAALSPKSVLPVYRLLVGHNGFGREGASRDILAGPKLFLRSAGE